MILELFLLVWAHCMGDMTFQSTFIAQNKGTSWLPMLSHIVIYSGTVTIGLIALSLFTWWNPILLLVSHLMIDRWKSRLPKDPDHWNCLYYDQAMHLAIILIVGVF